MTDAARLDSAHERWDRWWKDAARRTAWSEPEPAVTDRFDALAARGARTVLDVGAGIGRHALAYAAEGFDVIAVDASETAIAELRARARDSALQVGCHRSRFSALAVADGTIDHVLAWNVVYHGDTDVAATAFGECRRVLATGGSFQLTMLSKRHSAYGVGTEVGPDTYVDASSTSDKDHPHLYVDAVSLTRLLADSGFAVQSLVDVEQRRAGAWHWTAVAEAVGPAPSHPVPRIRAETPDDHDAIAQVVAAAFGSPAEARLVDAIRASPEYVPELALVAEIDGRVVGHVMISFAALVDDLGARRRVAMLSPLAVSPDRQRAGIGGALVREVTARAASRGEPLVVLEGSPTYYARFGFEPSAARGIELPLPSWAPADAAQVLRLTGVAETMRGRVVYPPAFDAVAEAPDRVVTP
jgi:predicted N-acetyltransferase YhbS/2-polyprenyl-3-methyl-5-hydroxy-6-metoxy-1,4-benzoquinol methylase